MVIPSSSIDVRRTVGSLTLALLLAPLACGDGLADLRDAVELAPTAETFQADDDASFTITNGSTSLLTLRLCNTGRLQVLYDGRWEHVVRPRGDCLLMGPTYIRAGETSRPFGIPPGSLAPGTYRAFQKVWVDESPEVELMSAPFEVRASGS